MRCGGLGCVAGCGMTDSSLVGRKTDQKEGASEVEEEVVTNLQCMYACAEL
jgi:hypothetical protein